MGSWQVRRVQIVWLASALEIIPGLKEMVLPIAGCPCRSPTHGHAASRHDEAWHATTTRGKLLAAVARLCMCICHV